MGLVKGIEGMKHMQKEVEKARSASGGRVLFLKEDGDIALVRFLTEGDEIIIGKFHSIKKMSSNGKQYWTDIYCSQEPDCPYCNSNDPDETKTSFKFLAWVFVYYKLHSDQDNDEWETEERMGETYYKEIINKPMILRQGYKLSKVVTALYAKYGTLRDRDYEMARSGKGLDTDYSFMPEDKAKAPKIVKEFLDKIGQEEGYPDLEAYVENMNKAEEEVATADDDGDEGEDF